MEPAAPELAATAPVLGTVIANRYRLERRLGSGGMGVVFEAHDRQLDRTVALKLLKKAGERASQRFQREARMVAGLRGDHIVQVLEYGESDDGLAYMALEYLEGNDLAAELRRVTQLSPQIAVRYLMETCEALAEAHRQGIIHRDLKPANLFLVRLPDGSRLLKVLDFGVGKQLASEQHDTSTFTEVGAALGTPVYMAPEQLRNASDVDPRSDIWALGVVLFECLVGARPFDGSTSAAVGARIATVDAPRARSVFAEVPEDLDRIIACCLSKDPAERFGSVLALAEALTEAYPEEAPKLTRIRAVSAPEPKTPAAADCGYDALTVTETPGATAGPPPRRGRPALWLWAAAATLGTAGGLGYAFGSGSQDDLAKRSFEAPRPVPTTAKSLDAGAEEAVPPTASADAPGSPDTPTRPLPSSTSEVTSAAPSPPPSRPPPPAPARPSSAPDDPFEHRR